MRLPRCAALAVAAVVAPHAAAAGSSVTIADTGTTAAVVQADMTARALSAQGLTVTRVTQPGAQAAQAALAAGTIDAYTTDAATLLEGVLAQPKERVRSRLAGRLTAAATPRGIVVSGFTPGDDSPTVACTRAAMKRHRIGLLANLGAVAPSLSYGATPQHVVRADGLPALRARFRRVIVNVGNGRFTLIRNGRVHCVLASTAEPRVERLRLVTLRDGTRRLSGTPALGVMATSAAYLAGANPAYGPTVDRVAATITTDALRQMRGEIELDAQPVAAVVTARLAAAGIAG